MHPYINLLKLVELLRRSVPKTPRFNLFLALRGASDEVRLHSRFIGALLDPAHHALGEELLIEFLKEIKIPLTGHGCFSLRGLQVQVEYMQIDLLITNADHQAIIIENKIFAGDQEKQLRGYHDAILSRKYSPIFVRYLTIDAHLPSGKSLVGLDKELPEGAFLCISYAAHIRQWLENAERLATRDIPVRESISQYLAVINSLTGSDQEEIYMNGIVETLLIGENILLARDVRAAYLKALAKLQERLWLDIEEELIKSDAAISECWASYSLNMQSERNMTIDNFYRPGARDRKYYGLYFTPPGFKDIVIGIVIESKLYLAIICDSQQREAIESVKKVLAKAKLQGSQTPTAPFWRWSPGQHNLQEPTEATLAMLCDEERRRAFACACAQDAIELWNLFGKN